MADRVLHLKPWESVAYASGRKSQFCRVVKPQPTLRGSTWIWDEINRLCVSCESMFPDAMKENAPFQPGDRIVGKESWCQKVGDDDRFVYNAKGNLDETCCLYRADGEDVRKVDGDGFTEFNKDGSEASPWRSPVTMPVWASRCTPTVTAVRLVRCQKMSEKDLKAQGVVEVEFRPDDGFPLCAGYMIGQDDGKTSLKVTPQEAFAKVFDLDHGPGSWAANKWVWLIDTERGGE